MSHLANDVWGRVVDALDPAAARALASTARRWRRLVSGRQGHWGVAPDAPAAEAHRVLAAWLGDDGPSALFVTVMPAAYHGHVRSAFQEYARRYSNVTRLVVRFRNGPRRRAVWTPEPLRLPPGLRELRVEAAPPTFDVAVDDAPGLTRVWLSGRILDNPHRGRTFTLPRWLWGLPRCPELAELVVTQDETGPRRRRMLTNTLLPAAPLLRVHPEAPVTSVALHLLDQPAHALQGLAGLSRTLRRLHLRLYDQARHVPASEWGELAATLGGCAALETFDLILEPGWSGLSGLARDLCAAPPPGLRRLLLAVQDPVWHERWGGDDEAGGGLHTVALPLCVDVVLPPGLRRLGLQVLQRPATSACVLRSWLARALTGLSVLEAVDHPLGSPAMHHVLQVLQDHVVLGKGLPALRALRLGSREGPRPLLAPLTERPLPLQLVAPALRAAHTTLQLSVPSADLLRWDPA